MRMILLLFVFTMFMLTCYAQHNFSLQGNVPSKYEGAEVVLYGEGGSNLYYNTIVKHGKYILSGTLKEDYLRVYLVLKRKDENIGRTVFFISPSHSRIDIFFSSKDKAISFKYFDIPFLEANQEYVKKVNPIEDSLSKTDRLFRLVEKTTVYKYNKDSLEFQKAGLRKRLLAAKVGLTLQMKDIYAGLYFFKKDLLPTASLNADSLMAIFQQFPPSLQRTDLGEGLLSTIKQRQSIMINHLAPDFSFTAKGGMEYSLSSFRNRRYVLVCFWDAGCAPCIKSVPLLKQLWQQYQPAGLEIIHVSIDNDTTKWNRSLDRLKMPWLQTCDLPPFVNGYPIRNTYDIHYIPNYLLINKSGKIIYQNVESGDGEDYMVLRSLLKKELFSEGSPLSN